MSKRGENYRAPCQFLEYDKTGNLVAKYAESEFRTATTDRRIDRIVQTIGKTLWQQVLDIFLPAGYPSSVSEDYMQYQIYDSLQAFSSSIAGLIASRAVLEGVGVGNANASPTAALLLSTMQDSMGRIATILFAHKLGTALEPECKMYRLLADIFNDAAMILDCLSPAFPIAVRVVLLSGSSILRALCGVAAGSAKASLSAHFARCGNLGELNAKDSSQETVISLLGMLAGSVVVSWVTSPIATWTTLMVLLAMHLATNHAAVRAVRMTTFNRQRCNIVFSHLVTTGQVLTPPQAAEKERIFEWDGALRWADGVCFGHCSLGVSLQRLAEAMAEPGHATNSFRIRHDEWSSLLCNLQTEPYLLWIEPQTCHAFITLIQGVQDSQQIQAWVHALLACHQLKVNGVVKNNHDVIDTIAETKRKTQSLFVQHEKAIRAAGWSLEAGVVLETRSGSRLRRGRLSEKGTT